ncbi:MAG: DinB family protein [bacterium]|nr:DinB family protein [bacterium]
MIERMRGTQLALKTGTMFVARSLAEVSEEDFVRRMGENSNSLQWVMGHLISSRSFMLQQLGLDEPIYCEGLFRRGQAAQESSNYPSKEKMLSDWDDISKRLLDAIESADEETLTGKAEYTYPIEDETVYGGTVFLGFHEAYHIGQIAYIQKMLGMKTLAG